MNETIFKLNTKNDKNTRITLEELSETIVSNSYDVPNHADGIKRIMGAINVEHKLKEVYVSNSPRTGWGYNDSPSGDPLKQSILKNFIFRRLIAKIDIPIAINGGSLQMAIKYDNNKYTVAFGANIQICSNMMILGSGDVINTGLRGNDRMDFSALIKTVKVWIEEAEQKAANVNRFIKNTNNVLLTQDDVNRLIGVLSRASVLTGPNQILKGYQVTQLCKNINNAFSNSTETITAWQMWNECTDNIEVYNTDINSYIENSLNITKFCDSFPKTQTMIVQ